MKEVEAKLLVRPIDQEEFKRQLLSLRSIGSFKLLEPQEPVVRILDVYYDTRDRNLQARGMLLRLRTENGARKITLKRRASEEDLLHRRDEVEAALNSDSLERILQVLVHVNALRGDLVQPGSGPLRDLPEQVLASCGLVPVASVANTRHVREVTRDADVLATLSVDEVLLYRDERTKRELEIEIEAKHPWLGHVALEVAEELLRAYPGGVEWARKSKYERALELREYPEPARRLRLGRGSAMNEIEAKLEVVAQHGTLFSSLQTMATVAGCGVGERSQLAISDSYFDTREYAFLPRNWYLRVRSIQGIEEIVLRQMQRVGDPPVLETEQIRRSVHEHSLEAVIRRLAEEGVIAPPARVGGTTYGGYEEYLGSHGLVKSLAVDMDRTQLNLSEGGRVLGRLKLDDVTFHDPAGRHARREFREIELDVYAEEDIEKAEIIVSWLLERFEGSLQRTSWSKYRRGMAMLGKAGSLEDDGVTPIIIRTEGLVDSYLRTVARGFEKGPVVKRVFREYEPSVDEVGEQASMRSLARFQEASDAAMDRLSWTRKTRLGMIVALYASGLLFLAVGLQLLITGTAQDLAVRSGIGALSTAIGVLLEGLIVYPFRQISALEKDVTRLSLIGALLETTMDHIDDPMVRRMYLDRVWNAFVGDG